MTKCNECERFGTCNLDKYIPQNKENWDCANFKSKEKTKIKKDVVYAKKYLLKEVFKSKEKTKIEGIYNYQLKQVEAPVLDRKFLHKLNPKKTCISVQSNNKIKINEDKLIQEAIKSVERNKKYCEEHKTEHFGEYSLFSQIEVSEFMLCEYSFDKDVEGEYYLILWFTPINNSSKFKKHLFWYKKKNYTEWY